MLSPHSRNGKRRYASYRNKPKLAEEELIYVLFADTYDRIRDCRYIPNLPWLNRRGRADVAIHRHTAMGEGEVDCDGIFETLREMDFANRQLKPDASQDGGGSIDCVSSFGFSEKMDKKAAEAGERIEREFNWPFFTKTG